MAGKRSNYVLYGLLGFVALGLVGFGAQNFGGSVRSIGTAGSMEIGAQQYASALTRQMSAFEAQIGEPLTFQVAQSIGLDQSVLAGVISDRALDNEAALRGLSVGDARVRDQVIAIPAFAGLDGTFDRDGYRQTLAANNLTEAEFEATIRDDTARSLLQSAVVGGVPDPQVFTTAMLNYIGEKRSLTWARVDAAALSTPLAPPTDADLAAHYDANPADFTLPETRTIRYAWITPDMISPSVTIDDADLQQLYDDRLADFVKPERRLVERLVFIDPDAAAAAQARLAAGEVDFEALVSERGLALSDIDLGDVDLSDLGPAGEAVFAAAPGDVVGPFDSPLGPALFRMNAVLAAEEITLEQATPELRAELASARARRNIEEMIPAITDMLAGGATIDDLAAGTDLEAGEIVWTAEITDGIAAYESFRNVAETLEVGAFPKLDTMRDGGLFVAELVSITPPALQPLADVREAVVAGWSTSATQVAVLAEAERIAAALAEGATLTDFALAPTVSENLTRRDFVEGTPPEFMTEVFAMEPGSVKVIDGGDFAVVVRLDSVAPADLASEAAVAERDQINEQVAQAIAQDLLEAYSAAIQERTVVTIDEAAVAAINLSFQ